MLINFKKIKFVLIVTIISILTMSFAKKLDKKRIHYTKENLTLLIEKIKKEDLTKKV